jgi:predicted dithiol-disulfide oxidoreductase (DUF899 family)
MSSCSPGGHKNDDQKGADELAEHTVRTREEWLAARIALLAEEKELTRRSDELARKRQALPWVPVEKDYAFETDDRTKTLAELFEGRAQLLVYHFMFGPTVDGWPDAGCPGCSYTADFAVFTEEGRRTGIGFNFGTPRQAAEIDLRRDELHGLSAFALEDGVVYHTYSCYDRGTDVLNATWQLLDRTPKGRGDDPEGWPRRHDEYPND